MHSFAHTFINPSIHPPALAFVHASLHSISQSSQPIRHVIIHVLMRPCSHSFHHSAHANESQLSQIAWRARVDGSSTIDGRGHARFASLCKQGDGLFREGGPHPHASPAGLGTYRLGGAPPALRPARAARGARGATECSTETLPSTTSVRSMRCTMSRATSTPTSLAAHGPASAAMQPASRGLSHMRRAISTYAGIGTQNFRRATDAGATKARATARSDVSWS